MWEEERMHGTWGGTGKLLCGQGKGKGAAKTADSQDLEERGDMGGIERVRAEAPRHPQQV